MDTKNKIVLLADDDEDDRALFEQALSAADPSILFFYSEDGCQALERLGTRGFSPDVVFMDINMPVMNGIECLKKIKESKEYNKIPVVMYSTCGLSQTKDECLALGAAAFVQKPSSISSITDEIKNVFAGLP
ncbi:response regulator receiver domain-containing protein [Flavobacterium sp. 270]|uniref:response regulator n=1 Tax=Flavobacterium sp. 270 TaxID=2512114 RepID=UPI001064EA4E|nr:response regulator [Flavobacterium sp. 270]TDW47844.1 response regulator receiver domain-containing protein [Flavobacterium sp. 270]